MTLDELMGAVAGQMVTQRPPRPVEIKGGCGADLMSDVLAAIQPQAVLLTGLCNPQVVRTATMADVAAIVFVRGKRPTPDMIALADEQAIPLITTPYGMFEACGRLYQAGLPSFETHLMNDEAA
jgi:predicted transcriptional regulator